MSDLLASLPEDALREWFVPQRWFICDAAPS